MKATSNRERKMTRKLKKREREIDRDREREMYICMYMSSRSCDRKGVVVAR